MSNDTPRLIEVAFPLKQASLDSVHEKMCHSGHIKAIHIWPARRPLAACRAALITALLPDPGDYRHHRGGEDNGDAHLKNLLVHHQVIVPVTDGRLDLGPWQQVFYCEFDGGRPKRMIIKVLGE